MKVGVGDAQAADMGAGAGAGQSLISVHFERIVYVFLQLKKYQLAGFCLCSVNT